MKRLLNILLLLCLAVTAEAQKKVPYERTTTNQIMADRATLSRWYMGVPKVPGVTWKNYIPDSLFVNGLWRNTDAKPGLSLYNPLTGNIENVVVFGMLDSLANRLKISGVSNQRVYGNVGFNEVKSYNGDDFSTLFGTNWGHSGGNNIDLHTGTGNYDIGLVSPTGNISVSPEANHYFNVNGATQLSGNLNFSDGSYFTGFPNVSLSLRINTRNGLQIFGKDGGAVMSANDGNVGADNLDIIMYRPLSLWSAPDLPAIGYDILVRDQVVGGGHGYVYKIPSSTFALSSSLSSYTPYTGATSDVAIGAHGLSAQSIYTTGTSGVTFETKNAQIDGYTDHIGLSYFRDDAHIYDNKSLVFHDNVGARTNSFSNSGAGHQLWLHDEVSGDVTVFTNGTIRDYNTNKLYLKEGDALPTAGGTLTGPLYLHADAVNAMEPITKGQFDNYTTGVTWKQEVRVRTTGNITLSGTQTVDGVSLAVNDRVLVMAQTAGADNGIYLVKSGSWTRSVDADASTEISTAAVLVRLGTLYKNTQWTCTNATDPVIGTDAITFGQIAGVGTYTNGPSMSLSGNVFDVNYTTLDARYVTQAGSFANPSFITSLAQSKITYTGSTSQYVRGDGSFSTFATDVQTVGDARYGQLTATNDWSGTYNKFAKVFIGGVNGGSQPFYVTGSYSGSGLASFYNTSTSGYSSFDFYSSANALQLAVGYGNASVSNTALQGINYFLSPQSSRFGWLFGASTEAMSLTTTGLGLATTAPTHSLTFGSTSTFLSMNNQTDQTTNYERLRLGFSGNVAKLVVENGGTGALRNLNISSGISQITIGQTAAGSTVEVRRDASGISNLFAAASTALIASSGIQSGVASWLSIAQSSSAGYIANWANVRENSLGSGIHYLYRGTLSTGDNASGTLTDKFWVDNTGLTKSIHLGGLSSAPTITAGTGAGTSPTVSVSGNDIAATVTITTGTSPTASATVATVTFNTAFGAAPKLALFPSNGPAIELASTSRVFADEASTTTTTATLKVGAGGLAASTTYKFTLIAIQ
ncbi:hypothetical protein [Mucilaginibacter sp.]|uniref:hypothetical protein n=1 Tax=Mucilaginibacter sp. TaxID=1882438 RepID=UPI003265A4CD